MLHPHSPVPNDPLAELLDVMSIMLVEPSRNRNLYGPTDDMVGFPAANSLGRRVAQHKLLPSIHGDDSVHCRVDNVSHLNFITSADVPSPQLLGEP